MNLLSLLSKLTSWSPHLADTAQPMASGEEAMVGCALGSDGPGPLAVCPYGDYRESLIEPLEHRGRMWRALTGRNGETIRVTLGANMLRH